MVDIIGAAGLGAAERQRQRGIDSRATAMTAE
jgi:hypothetical protein